MDNNLRIVIDAGHGGRDPGALGNGYLEKDLTLQISQYMYDKFTNLGIPTKLIRTTDETISPNERVKRILEAYGNDPNVVVISNHLNASDNENAMGAEVIYSLRNDEELAKNILDELARAGQMTRRYYQRTLTNNPNEDYYFVLRNTKNTTPVLIEYGFITNTEDIQRVVSNLENYADAVVRAVLKTYQINEGINGNNYIVQRGDSLWSIANKYGISVNELKALNNMQSNMIYVGQTLIVPSDINNNEVYTVKANDTLWSIARRYNTTIQDIRILNNLDIDNLSIGQKLLIPK